GNGHALRRPEFRREGPLERFHGGAPDEVAAAEQGFKVPEEGAFDPPVSGVKVEEGYGRRGRHVGPQCSRGLGGLWGPAPQAKLTAPLHTVPHTRETSRVPVPAEASGD